MKVNNVCRLCLSNENLCWFLEYRADMKDIVLSTTGVEILTSDIISQKICRKCCEIVMKMWHYRRKTQESDKYLKNLSDELMKEGQLAASYVIINDTETNSSHTKEDKKNIVGAVEEKKINIESESKVHSSVRSIFESYPKIKIPRLCLKSDISPFVFLPMGEVEDYCKAKGITINEQAKLLASSSNDESTTLVRNNELTAVDRLIETIVENSLREKKQLEQRASKPACNDKEKDTPPVIQMKNNDASSLKIGAKRKLSLDFAIDNSNETVQVTTTVKTYVCDICYAVLYKQSDLKRHYYRHGQKCPFCKKRCKSIMQKQIHMKKDCAIVNAMQSDPKVKLIKLENDKNIINTYTNVLDDLKLLSSKADENFTPVPMEISTVPKGSGNKIDCADKSNKVTTLVTNEISTIPEGNSNKIDCVGNNKTAVSSNNNIEVPPSSVTDDEISTYRTVSIVIPDIRIQNDDFPMDNYTINSSDKDLMRDLLLTQPHPIKPTDKISQISLIADTSSYTVDECVPSITLRKITKFFDKYPVPVIIENGCEGIVINENFKDQPTKKIVNLWDSSKHSQPNVPTLGKVFLPIDQKAAATSNNMNVKFPNANIRKNQSDILPNNNSNFQATLQKNYSSAIISHRHRSMVLKSKKVYKPNLVVRSNISSKTVDSSSLKYPISSTIVTPQALTSIASNTITTISSSSRTAEVNRDNNSTSLTKKTFTAPPVVHRRQNPLIIKSKSPLILNSSVNSSKYSWLPNIITSNSSTSPSILNSSITTTTYSSASKIPTAGSVQRKVKTLNPQRIIPKINIRNLAPRVLPPYIPRENHSGSTVVQTYTKSTMNNLALSSSSSLSSHIPPSNPRTSVNVMNTFNGSLSQSVNTRFILCTKEDQSNACAASVNTATTSEASKNITIVRTPTTVGTPVPISGTIRVKPVWELR